MNDDPKPLKYRAPSRTDDISVTRTGGLITIELPPMSTGTFVAVILPEMFWLTISSSFAFVACAYHRVSWVAMVVASLGVVAAGSWVYRLCQFRDITRRAWASPIMMGCVDARTGNGGWKVTATQYGPLTVIRPLERPWVFQLTARLKRQQNWISGAETFVLAYDTNRSRLEAIAAILETARAPSSGNVPGAFEVLAVKRGH